MLTYNGVCLYLISLYMMPVTVSDKHIPSNKRIFANFYKIFRHNYRIRSNSRARLFFPTMYF